MLILLVRDEACREHVPGFNEKLVLAALLRQPQRFLGQVDARGRLFIAGLTGVQFRASNLFPECLEGFASARARVVIHGSATSSAFRDIGRESGRCWIRAFPCAAQYPSSWARHYQSRGAAAVPGNA